VEIFKVVANGDFGDSEETAQFAYFDLSALVDEFQNPGLALQIQHTLLTFRGFRFPRPYSFAP
jgi:hypothetical protein